MRMLGEDGERLNCMLSSILSMANQVLILLVLIGVGFVFGKCKLLNDMAADGLTSIMLYVATPCALIDSFCREYDPSLLRSLATVFIIAIISHIINIMLAHFFVRDQNVSTQRVLRFGVVFGNCGYMGLPLQSALYGSIGVFYGAAYIAVFTLFIWTYGIFAMSGKKSELSLRQLIVNPGIIGTVFALAVFFFSIPLPEVIYGPIHYMGLLNVPIPMIIIGYYLSKMDLRTIWSGSSKYICALLRLIVTPLVLLGILYLFQVRGEVLVCSVISASVPVAAMTTMFAAKYKQDCQVSTTIVSMTTLASIVTMPLIVGLAQYLS